MPILITLLIFLSGCLVPWKPGDTSPEMHITEQYFTVFPAAYF
jgi:hypothetical protein